MYYETMYYVSPTISEIFTLNNSVNLKWAVRVVQGRWNMAPFDLLLVCHYKYSWIPLSCTISELFDVKNIVIIKSGLRVIQGNWKWYHSKALGIVSYSFLVSYGRIFCHRLCVHHPPHYRQHYFASPMGFMALSWLFRPLELAPYKGCNLLTYQLTYYL